MNLFAKKSHINILIIFIITIISFAVFSLWYTNYTISGVMLKKGIKDENIIFNINRNQWKIFLFKQKKGNTYYVGFVNIMKQSNGPYKVSKIVLPIISNKVIVYTNYSDVKNGIPRIATVVGGVIKTEGNKDVYIAVNYQNQRKEVEKIEKTKEVENYLFFIYDIGYHTTPVTCDVMSK